MADMLASVHKSCTCRRGEWHGFDVQSWTPEEAQEAVMDGEPAFGRNDPLALAFLGKDRIFSLKSHVKSPSRPMAVELSLNGSFTLTPLVSTLLLSSLFIKSRYLGSQERT